MTISDLKERRLLATAAAYGIMNSNSAVQLPAAFTKKELIDLSDLGFAEVHSRLEALEEKGFLRSRNTGYYGYGDQYVEGDVTWQITAKGLIALWS